MSDLHAALSTSAPRLRTGALRWRSPGVPSAGAPSWLLVLAAMVMVLMWPFAYASAQKADAPGGVLPVPALSGHVVDRTDTLNAAQKQALEDKLMGFERERGTQIAILLVPTTQPEDIAAYAQRVGDAWKIGRRDVGDGVLIVVARQDRAVRIEVAKALEGAVPDLAASRIIEQAMLPAFKAGDFAGGLHQGIDQLAARIKGENLPLPGASPSSRGARQSDGFDLQDLFVFGLIGVPIVFGVLRGLLGRKGGAMVTGFLSGGAAWLVTGSILIALGAWVVSSLLALAFGNGGRGLPGGGWGGPPMGGGGFGGGMGGGFGGRGGGGWSSGGGGDFGGGGASGRW